MELLEEILKVEFSGLRFSFKKALRASSSRGDR